MHTVARTSENLEKCRCSGCPSYTARCKVKSYPLHLLRMIDGIDNMEHYEAMFCAFGKSNCIHEDKGCLCEDCEVFLENDLSRDEYCMSDNGRSKYNSIFGFKKKNNKHDS
jgi:hypothetical protein